MTPSALADIHHAAFTHGRPWRAAEFEQLLSAKVNHLITTDHGFAVIQLLPPEVELLTIAVHPEHQGKGLGRILMRELCIFAAAKGAAHVFLEVDARNEAARTLYEKTGFAQSGTRIAYYSHPDGSRSDAILMTRPLDAEQTGKQGKN